MYSWSEYKHGTKTAEYKSYDCRRRKAAYKIKRKEALIMTQINFICEKQGHIGRKEIVFNDYINSRYAIQAIKASRVLRQKIGKIKSEVRFGQALIHALQTTPRYAYIKNCNLKGNEDNTCDIEIDLINQTYRQVDHLD